MFQAIMNFLNHPPEIINTLLPFLFDIILRLYPTKNPAGIIHTIARVARLIAKLCTQIADLTDKVLPQKVKNENVE